MKISRLSIISAAAVLLVLTSCSLFTNDELSEAEEEFVSEQAAASVSEDEGGAVYVADKMSDPEYYEELEASEDLEYDSSTGTFSINVDADFPNASGSSSIQLEYTLYDASGNIQSVFSRVTTRKVVAEFVVTLDVSLIRYTSTNDLSGEITVEGINTGTVTVNGTVDADRSVETTSAAARDISSEMSISTELENLGLSYNETYGYYEITGGSAESTVSGSVNGKSFSRTAEWVFGEGGTAELTIGDITVTVNIETGEIE